MDSPLLRTIVPSACLAARSVHQTLSYLHDDDDFQQPDGHKLDTSLTLLTNFTCLSLFLFAFPHTTYCPFLLTIPAAKSFMYAPPFCIASSPLHLLPRIPLVMCGISEAYTHAWLSSSMIVASWGNPIRFNIPHSANASSFKHWFTALISDSAVDVDSLPWALFVKLTTLRPMYPMCALVECELSKLPAKSASQWKRAWVNGLMVSAS